ncbi:MAG: hypothetical protein CMO10_04650 [Thalassospira sp.]|nr:hypothetical protein [Thalassospira sp.]|tara:strand:- start:1066 stop:1947 length:882 start_codon:yes stop_codon:yes gene_type:complete
MPDRAKSSDGGDMTFSILIQFMHRSFLIGAITLLAACSQKAETLKLSVTQFGTATEQAFDHYDAAYSTQFAPFPKSDSAKQRAFVANIEAFTGKVTAANIDTLLDPDAVKIDPDVARQWQDTLKDLRSQYQQFVAIFDNIEAGSALGASAVTQSGPILEKLRKQLATISTDFAKTPPQFVTRRGTLIAELNQIKTQEHNNPEAEKLLVQAWWQRWNNLITDESTMQADTLRAFVTALALGNKLQGQIDNYTKLDMASLISAVEDGIKLSDQIGKLSPAELATQGTALLETATN